MPLIKTELKHNIIMNNHKYIAKFYDFTVTKDNFIKGEDPENTGWYFVPIDTIAFNTLKELKELLGEHFDNNDFYIMHNEDNRYDVQWTASDRDGYLAPTEEEWEKFKNNEIDLYACVMQIEIYRIEKVTEDTFSEELD